MSAPTRLLLAALPFLLAADPPPPGAVARLGSTRLRHADRPTCVAFSADGKRLVSGGNDGVVSVWDVATGARVASVRRPETWVTALRFTHAARLAVTYGDNRIRFLHPGTLSEVGEVEALQTRWLALSHDGALAAVLSAEGTIQVVEVANGVPQLELPASARAPAFAPDGKSVASADEAGTVTVRRIVGGKPLFTARHPEKFENCTFSPDGTRLTTTGGGKVRVWTLGKGMPVELEARGPVVFVGNDRLAAVRGSAVGVWDFGKGAWTSEVQGVAGAFALSPDGSKLASTGTGLRVRLWDVASGKEMHADGDSFPDAALLAPAADGKNLFVAAGARGFRWSIPETSAEQAATFATAVTAAGTGGGRLVLAGDQSLSVWDSFDPTRPLPATPNRTVAVPGVKLLVVSDDGKRVAVTGEDRLVRLIDPTAGRAVRTLPIETGVLALAFTPDGATLLTHGRDGSLRAWPTTAEDAAPRWTAQVQRGPWGALAVSPDGKFVVAGSAVRLVVLHADTGKEAFAFERDSDDAAARAVAFTPDSRLLVVGSHGTAGAVQVWEIATRSRVRTFASGGVTRLAVFPDGKRLATAGADETITVWDMTFRKGKPEPTDEELQAAWVALGSRSAAVGVPAVRTLEVGGRPALKVIRAGLTGLVADNRRIAGLVRDLDADDFETREKASAGLAEYSHRALPAVILAADTSGSAEVRKRARDIILGLSRSGVRPPAHGLAGDGVRLVRAVGVLEVLGGAESLAEIAEYGGRVGDEAKAALARLRR